MAASLAEQRKLTEERDILRQAAKYFAVQRTGEPLPIRCRPPGRLGREAVVRGHRDRTVLFLRLACRRARTGGRQPADAALAAKIRQVQDPARGGDRAYCAPRVTAELNDGPPESLRVNHKRVARIMREHALAGIRLRRRVKTAVPDQAGRKLPDLLGRELHREGPEPPVCRRYHLPAIAHGTNVYLATVIDLCSRKLAGWAMAGHMRTEFVEDALTTAWGERGSLAGARISLRPRVRLHVQGLRRALRDVWGEAVDGCDRLQRGQRRRGVVQREPETRPPRRRCGVPGPGHRPPGRVLVGEPLQHPQAPLRDRQRLPEHLRSRRVRYAHGSGIYQHDTVSKIKGQGPSSNRARHS